MKLPLWRLFAGSAILAALVTVLSMLAPVYLANFRLQRYLQSSLTSSRMDDETLRRQAAGRARDLALPVDSSQVMVTHSGAQTRVEIRYAVRRDFGLYQVDVHFHPAAAK